MDLDQLHDELPDEQDLPEIHDFEASRTLEHTAVGVSGGELGAREAASESIVSKTES